MGLPVAPARSGVGLECGVLVNRYPLGGEVPVVDEPQLGPGGHKGDDSEDCDDDQGSMGEHGLSMTGCLGLQGEESF